MSISHQRSSKSRIANRKLAVKIVKANQKSRVYEQHFFLVASEMRSRIKCLMSDCNDAFVREQVIFTSFIGNKEEDDILMVLKNGRYLIFDHSGSVVRLEAEFKIK
jgi:hypothetical protein